MRLRYFNFRGRANSSALIQGESIQVVANHLPIKRIHLDLAWGARGQDRGLRKRYNGVGCVFKRILPFTSQLWPRRMSRCSTLLVLYLSATVIYLSGCVPPRIISTNSTRELSPDLEAAQKLSSSLADDLINDRRSAIRASLEKRFRDAIDEEHFNAMLDQMIEVYGKPLDFELKQHELGSKEYDNDQTKPMRKFWYAAQTTKYEKGSHFLIVEVVPDDRRLAVSSFAIVNFPIGIPPGLK